MVDLINSVNNMQVAKPRVGVIKPPDSSTRANLYNDAEASKKFKELNRELSNADRKVDYSDKKKTYKGILISAGIVIAGLILMPRGLIARIKNLSIKDVIAGKLDCKV